MNRKQLILETSLELFAKNGVVGTTTKSIANEAGVSEGLLFRHYQSKEGLVKALKKLAADKVRILAQEIIDLTQPKDVLRLTILSLTKIPFKDYALWKLILGIKFQSELADESLADVIEDKVTKAFKGLGFAHAEMEAELLLNSLNGMLLAMLLNKQYKIEPLLNLMLKKYQLNKRNLN